MFIAISTSILFLIAISPYYFHNSIVEWYNSWQKLMFADICHQKISRTIHQNGIPAAVCGRCLGIYAFLSIGFIFIPIIKRFLIEKFRYSKVLLLTMFLIIVTDYSLQWISLYEGSNMSRFISGSLLGLSTTVFIIYHK
ncbi:MAG: DUF2085 domain-containing protein [Balneolales bacterium]